MPELPEVEKARILFEQHSLGAKLTEIDLKNTDEIIFSPEFIQCFSSKFLLGSKVTHTARKGKYFWICFDHKHYLLIHLGMTGYIVVEGKEMAKYKTAKRNQTKEELLAWPPRFVKFTLTFQFDDRKTERIAFADARRFGRVKWFPDCSSEEIFLSKSSLFEIGPDVLLDLPSSETLHSMLQLKRAPLKAILLDQHFLSGLGNWMVDEVLFQSRIHPEQSGCDLSISDVEKLHNSIDNIVKFAVSVNADSSLFPKDWLFHYRWDKGKRSRESSEEADFHKISFLTVGGRTSAIVPSLQKKRSKSNK